ncbi:MAG: hypothetical protein L3J13_08240 [Devosiaceae bacterium]|nr:hypothetical protein [Devosiaceae bacterium]
MEYLWYGLLGAGFGVVLAMALNILTAEKILTKVEEAVTWPEMTKADLNEAQRKFKKAELLVFYVQPLVLIVFSTTAAILFFGAER